MKDDVLNEIRDFAINKLKDAYGYCGLADSDKGAHINSDDKNGKGITIILKIEDEA